LTERLLTSRELGGVLGFSAAWVQDRFEARDLPGFRISGRLRFRLSEVEVWLETKRAGAGGDAPATPQRPPELVSLTPATPK
jgi:predicted DNA-binding transcriptional regulator AlpA